jgi:Flp pilus assembly protein TadB
MSVLAVVLAVVLGGALLWGVAVIGVPITYALLILLIMSGWLVVATLVRRDARRLGIEEEWPAMTVMAFGWLGVVWWAGYRTGRADAVPAARTKNSAQVA